MKKILLTLILPIFLFSFELTFNKSFRSSATSDILSTYISITISSKDDEVINTKMENFQTFIDDYDDVTKLNGTYSITPRYQYTNGKSIFKNYQGNLRYTIQTKQTAKMNEFISSLQSIKKDLQDKKVLLSISNIRWQISKSKYEKLIDNLRLEAINWIENYARNLNKNCMVKNISINRSYANNYPMMSRMEASPMKKSFSVNPSNSNKDIKLTVNYKLECR